MNKEQAKAVLLRWRQRRKYQSPESDVAFLQTQIEGLERSSIILGIMFFSAMSGCGLFNYWWWLFFLAGVAFGIGSRVAVIRLRRVLPLFQEHGPQKIEEIQIDNTGQSKIDKAMAGTVIARCHRWVKWRTLPESDAALLQTQADSFENCSFISCIILFGTIDLWKSSGYWALFCFTLLAAAMYLRWEVTGLRKALRLFQAQGPQKIEDIKDKEE